MKKKQQKNRTGIYVSKKNDDVAIAKLRQECGLRPITVGKLNCLKCNKLFFSEDTTRNKICYECNSYYLEE